MWELAMWQFWLIVAGICFIFEMATVGFLIFWLGLGALFAMVTSFITDNIFIQTIVFVISSIVFIFFTKPFVKKFIDSKDSIVTNSYSIIGKHAIVIKTIDSTQGEGQIKVDGDIWSAKCDSDETIPKGAEVIIQKIDGVKAVVELEEKVKSKI